jgi:nitrite reductase/ring-hydroxylating ferredoxin subunit
VGSRSLTTGFVIGPARDLRAGSRKIVRIPGVGSVGVFNVAGEYFALKNACPHQGGPLCLGRLTGTTRPHFRPGEAPEIEWIRDGEILRCPWHNWEFDIRTGEAVFNGTKRVATYPVAIGEDAHELPRAETYPVILSEEVILVQVPRRPHSVIRE